METQYHPYDIAYVKNKMSHTSPAYQQKFLEFTTQKRKQREEELLKEGAIEEQLYQDYLKEQKEKPVKHFIETAINPMPKYTKKQAGERGRFSVVGHSMTCDNVKLSIPEGSRLIARRLSNDPKAIPLNKSLVIIWEEGDEKKCFIKTVSHVASRYIHCVSLNPDPYYEPFIVWLDGIIEILEVEQVIT